MKKSKNTLLTLCCMAVLPFHALAGDSIMLPENPSGAEVAQWKTYSLGSVDSVRPGAPPDQQATANEVEELSGLAASRSAEDIAAARFWNAGSVNYRWLELALDAYSGGPPGPKVARSLALLNVAIYDAMVASWEAKYHFSRQPPAVAGALFKPSDDPSYPSEHAAAAGAASTVLAYLFPDSAERFRTLADSAGQSRLIAGVNYPSDVDAGRQLGQAVGEKVVEIAKADGYGASFELNRPEGPGIYRNEKAVFANAGTWTTWAIEDPKAFLPAAPPPVESTEMNAELDFVRSHERTPPKEMLAWHWHSFDSAHRYWNAFITEKLFEYNLAADAPRAAWMYATIAIAANDALVACFEGKYTYWMARPREMDADIPPVLPTPPHPSYPSAHSCKSTAEAVVLGQLFPDLKESIMQAAHEAGVSRIIGGIHYPMDKQSGETLGTAVAQVAIDKASSMIGH